MGTNGNHNGKFHKFGAEIGAFWIAEGASFIVLPALVGAMDIIPASVNDAIGEVIGDGLKFAHLVKPIEKLRDKFIKLDALKDGSGKSEEELAKEIGGFIWKSAPPLVITALLKVKGRNRLEEAWKVPGVHGSSFFPRNAKQWLTFLADEGSHTVYMGLVAGPYAPQANKAVDWTTGFVQGLGVPEPPAHNVAVAAVLHEGPNLAAGVTASLQMVIRRLLSGNGKSSSH